MRTNPRLAGSAFEKILLPGSGLVTGRLDARHDGPAIDPVAAEADYDPCGSATGSALAAATNGHVRDTLRFGRDPSYQADADVPICSGTPTT